MADFLLAAAQGALPLLAAAAAFAALGLLMKRGPSRQMRAEAATNIPIYMLDVLWVAPAITFFVAAVGKVMPGWLDLGGVSPWLLGPAVLLVGDFVGYWRHRVQHTRLLWPAHAVHHSDRALSWFSLLRMHPIDRFGTAFDTIILAALGFPVWALTLNWLVRHYWGQLIHADVPWTLGRFDLVINSPAMHRWHHSREVHGKNFATVFSLWDRAFGTYYAPGPCEGPLGVEADMGKGALGQYLYPFRVWASALTRRAGQREEAVDADDLGAGVRFDPRRAA